MTGRITAAQGSARAAARTEGEFLDTLAGALTLEELYDLVGACRQVIERDAGLDVVHGTSDTRWKRRLRGALQARKRRGTAHRTGDRVWVLDGTPQHPRTAVLVSLTGAHAEVELRLEHAVETLRSLPGAADLVFADAPYGLGVGQGDAVDVGQRCYARDTTRVVPGYVDVPPGQYRAFTSAWVTAAAEALRPGGYLVAVTGPQQAAWTQVAAEDAGLTYVNSISADTSFPLRTTRRFAHAHWTITVVCSGPLTSAGRVFTPPPEMLARSGREYPIDTWRAHEIGRADAEPRAWRYANSLPVRLVDRLVAALTRPTPAGDVEAADLMVEPFLGGGTGALVALRRGLRYIGADLNPAAIAFTAHRLARELALPPARPMTAAGQPAQVALW